MNDPATDRPHSPEAVRHYSLGDCHAVHFPSSDEEREGRHRHRVHADRLADRRRRDHRDGLGRHQGQRRAEQRRQHHEVVLGREGQPRRAAAAVRRSFLPKSRPAAIAGRFFLRAVRASSAWATGWDQGREEMPKLATLTAARLAWGLAWALAGLLALGTAPALAESTPATVKA